jgi:hypothetical protein
VRAGFAFWRLADAQSALDASGMSATHTKIAVAANVPESFRMLLRAARPARAAGFDVHRASGPGLYLTRSRRRLPDPRCR